MSAVDQLQNKASSTEPTDEQKAAAAASAASVAKAVPGTGTKEIVTRDSRLKAMREHLASQPKERVRVARNTFVQINGYSIRIMAGESVSVPRQVYELLVESGRA